MAKTAAAESRQKERAAQRRTQILSAARACVLAEGFHVTTMDRIAAMASMSHGQLYRYFRNKEAVMVALSESEFEDLMLHLAQLHQSGDLDVELVVKSFRNEIEWLADRAALALDVLAEAGRNQQVSKLVLHFDRRLRAAFREIIEAILDGLSEQDINVRVEFMLLATRSLAVHAASAVCDHQILAAGFELALRGVLSPPKHFDAMLCAPGAKGRRIDQNHGLSLEATQQSKVDRTPSVTSRQKERLARRQAQILCAARTCVLAKGFHAATMSRIAAEAVMSVGHIYQYFENKDAIMFALSEVAFEGFMMEITKSSRSYGSNVDLIIEFISIIPFLLEYDRAALALEVLAEAGRNPKVAEMVARVDRRFRDTIRKIIETVLADLTKHEIDLRVEILLLLTRALAVHAGTHPINDEQVIVAGYELALQNVLSSPQRTVKI